MDVAIYGLHRWEGESLTGLSPSLGNILQNTRKGWRVGEDPHPLAGYEDTVVIVRMHTASFPLGL